MTQNKKIEAVRGEDKSDTHRPAFLGPVSDKFETNAAPKLAENEEWRKQSRRAKPTE